MFNLVFYSLLKFNALLIVFFFLLKVSRTDFLSPQALKYFLLAEESKYYLLNNIYTCVIRGISQNYFHSSYKIMKKEKVQQ